MSQDIQDQDFENPDEQEPDLQIIYFDLMNVQNNCYTTDKDQHVFYETIKNRRSCIEFHSKRLKYYRPILRESLIKIYFNPEISFLLDIISNSSSPRKYHNILRFSLNKQIQSQFPYGDNHTQMMNHFLHSFAINTEGPKDF